MAAGMDGGWYEYEKALIVELDTATGKADKVVEYVSPSDAIPDEQPAILFKSGTLQGDLLYTCTQTEVMVYRVPSFERLAYVSLPHFNDVHHVRPTPAGNLLVANTGLDMVMEVSLGGEVVQTWNVLGEEPWATRFEQRDAISLVDPSRRIDIGLERLHDGLVHDGRVYFTTVNGQVAI